MKVMRIVPLFFILCSFIIGQDHLDSLVTLEKKIDTTKQYIIYDYRLPEWGYNRVYLNFSGNISGYKNTGKRNEEHSNYSIQLTPNYTDYTESESMISLIQGSLVLYNSYQKQKVLNIDYTDNYRNTYMNTELNLDWDLQKYITTGWFIDFNTMNYFRYYENHSKTTVVNNGISQKSTSLLITRKFNPSVEIGVGYGRVRNVTPVFRALRFDERIKDLDASKALNTEEITELSDFLTRRDVYNQIYDRPYKYFYSQIPKSVLNRLDKLAPWEVMYLNDTWSEIIGDRFEGFNIHGGLSVNYEKNIYSPGNNSTELFLTGPYLEQYYYHNISMCYQVGINSYCTFLKVANDNTTYKYFGRGRFQISNLFNVTDKILSELNLGYEVAFADSKTEIRWQRIDNYFSDFSLIYFIENDLSLNTDISYNFFHNRPADLSFRYDGRNYYNSTYDKEKNWSIYLSLRYYIERGLF